MTIKKLLVINMEKTQENYHPVAYNYIKSIKKYIYIYIINSLDDLFMKFLRHKSLFIMLDFYSGFKS